MELERDLSNVHDNMMDLIRDLEEAHKTKKQNFHRLATRKNDKIVDYCALGALGCKQGMIFINQNKEFGKVLVEPDEPDILNKYGISDGLKHPVVIAYYLNGKVSPDTFQVANMLNLSSVITRLNDFGHWNFYQIAQYLRQLLNTGTIKACTKTEYKAAKKLVKEQRLQQLEKKKKKEESLLWY